jgi:hypothetical protein
MRNLSNLSNSGSRHFLTTTPSITANIEDTTLNSSSVILSAVMGILCSETCYLVATHLLLLL